MREALQVPSDLPPALSEKDDLYVFFTSGTSGKIPKGVVGSHRSTLRRIQWFQDTFQQLPKVAKRTPLTFVDSIAELLGTLLAPETVLVSLLGGPHATQLTDIGTLVQSTECCQVSMLPSQLEQLLRYRQSYPNACSCLKRIIISGEPCTENLWNAFRRAFYDVDKEEFHCQLVNLYGQTETTADCCAAVLTSISHDQVVVNHTVTIGKPLRDDVVIEEKSIGDDPELVELVVSGASCLANGYLIGSQDSGGFGWDGGRRLFETGDTGFYRDGFWYVQGRKDDVVKINGEWTNPAAVESAFLEFCRLHGLFPLPLTAASVVDDRLFIVVERVSGQASIEFSREIMKEKTRLPWNMIPHHVLECSAIPRTPGTGKVDRFQIKRLVRSMMDRQVNVGSSETTSEPNESLLLLFMKIVADVLQVPEAKVSELNNSKSFIDLGGDSASAISLHYELRLQWWPQFVDYIATMGLHPGVLNQPLCGHTPTQILNASTVIDIWQIITNGRTNEKKRCSKRARHDSQHHSSLEFAANTRTVWDEHHESIDFAACIDITPTVLESKKEATGILAGCQNGVIQRVLCDRSGLEVVKSHHLTGYRVGFEFSNEKDRLFVCANRHPKASETLVGPKVLVLSIDLLEVQWSFEISVGEDVLSSPIVWENLLWVVTSSSQDDSKHMGTRSN
ncbi:non-ribosomal peptide synthetase [Nitzschia inconspicua]|uniref:Non-ribosomal peptide synthetase n=1 Tax=Nitzschia inconspicua TaxID=303405 RepID=A0A9K3L3Q6_9STRA|nr:non-ribosomal peptide synthetase [Nitzschia inconspicua]